MARLIHCTEPASDYWTRLDREAQAVAAAVIDVRPFFDAVRIWTTRPTSPEDQRAIRRHCPKAFRDDKHPPRYRPFIEAWTLPQPDAEVVGTMDRVAGRDYAIINIEIALDLIVRDEAAQRRVGAWVDRHLCLPRRPRQTQPTGYGNGTYAGPRYRVRSYPDGTSRARPIRVNGVVYYDRPSKTDGHSPAVHIERRLTTGPTLEAAGIATLPDLVGFDHRAFWERHLIFRRVDPAVVARTWRANAERPAWQRPGMINDEYEAGRVITASAAIAASTDYWCPDLACADALVAFLRNSDVEFRIERVAPRFDANFLVP
jgi:hypothetical protein